MIAIIDYGVGNLFSLKSSLAQLGQDTVVTADPDTIRKADRLILPGVGAFGDAMDKLVATGLVPVIRAKKKKKPLLGICLGMQLLYERSEEGDVACLGLLPGTVRRLLPAPGIRIPHMGWNRLRRLRPSALLDGVADDASAYFVHSYAAPVSADTVAASDHGGLFSAVVQRGRHCGAQFHPERSAATGARILGNFLEMDF